MIIPVERAFREQSSIIVFSTNESFAPYVSVMLQSIIDRSSSDETYDILILTADVEEETFSLLRSQVAEEDNFSLRLLDVSQMIEGYRFFTENSDRISKETYFRLLIPELCANYERTIYLDGDMVSRIDISRLYYIPFDGKSVISTRDLWGTATCYIENNSLRSYREDLLGSREIDDYFIAGFLIFDQNKIKKISTKSMLELASSREWLQHDQDVLNQLFFNDVKIIDASWDFMFDKYDDMKHLPRALRDEYYSASVDPKIIHYGGSRKPWKFAYMAYDFDFWETASRSPFFEKIFFGMSGNLEYKVYLLRHLFKDSPTAEYKKNDIYFYYDDKYLGRFSRRSVVFDFLRLQDDYLIAEGYIPTIGFDDPSVCNVVLYSDGEVYESVPITRYKKVFRNNTDDLKWEGSPFRFVVDLDKISNSQDFYAFCKVGESYIHCANFRYEKFSAIGNEFREAYQFANGRILQSKDGHLTVRKVNQEELDTQEEKFLEELSYKEGFADIKNLREQAQSFSSEKDIWLFSDRANKADDNGEAMFLYACEHKEELNVEPVFVVREDSADFNRLAQIGRVVPYLSKEHKLLHLVCTFNFSAQADFESFNPFGEAGYHAFRDLLQKPKFVFLQHGVIKNDISRWFNRTNINPWLFITSAKRELDSVLFNPKYNLDESIVKLTGLPRHDRLYDNSQKIITIMPTWRKYLVERTPENLGVWSVKEGFCESEYFSFYNGLLSNQKLLAAIEEAGYRLAFMPHPNIQEGINLFYHDSRVIFFTANDSYREVFAKSSLVVTDYSSSVMDFAYLRKPIVYTHFDEDEMFNGVHIAVRGYFDDTRDGFGEVTHSLEELVDIILEYVQNECALKDFYRDRINRFFRFDDRNNRERVLAEVRKKEALPIVASVSKKHTLSLDDNIRKQRSKTSKKKALNLACKKIGFSCRKKYTYSCLFGQALCWYTPFETKLSIFEPTQAVVKKKLPAKWSMPCFSNCESADYAVNFMNHLGALMTGSIPYSNSDWNEDFDRTLVGKGWRLVPLDSSLELGDIVCFSTNQIAMVCRAQEKRIVFIYSKNCHQCHRIYVGALNGFGRSTKADKLPKPKWILRFSL